MDGLVKRVGDVGTPWHDLNLSIITVHKYMHYQSMLLIKRYDRLSFCTYRSTWW